MIILNYKQANERDGAFMDHSGVLRDVRTGNKIGVDNEEEDEEDDELNVGAEDGPLS